ncbi:MAG: redoxin domain-containing protein [Phycisphaerales bacterium]|nr:MAG: redoxin domain-containing protein [Phycisphaerales bacterium]
MMQRLETPSLGSLRLLRYSLPGLLLAGFVCGLASAQQPGSTASKKGDELPSIQPADREPQAVPPVDPNQPGPRIKIDKPVYDFGEVWVTPTLDAVFEVRNVGTEPLHITNVKPACGCTLKGEYDKEIAPGGVGKIPLKLRTKGLMKFKKSVTITCDDLTNPTPKIFLAGEIKYYLSADPMRVNFIKIAADETVKQVVSLTANTDEAEPTLVGENVVGKFKATLAQTDDPKRYELLIEGLPPFNQGSNTANFVIKTGVPQQPEITIPVRAYVPPRLDIRPTQLIIPRPSDREIKRTITVMNNGETPVEVLGATVTNSDISADILTQTKGERYRIALTLPPNYQPPAAGDKLTIKLLDGTEKDHVIPIVGRPQKNEQQKPERPAMTLLGKPAPQTTLALKDGTDYSVGSGDEILVLNFYATWCGFSKRQAPDVEKVYQTFKANPKVRVISVSEDRTEGPRGRPPDQVVASFEERGMTHGLALDPTSEVGQLYKATSFPTLFLLKGEKVEAVHIGAKKDLSDTLISQINDLLAGKPLKQEPPTPTEAPKPPQQERPAMTFLGKPAPKATLNLYEGGTYQLGSGDEIVVLNFYATWCGFSKRQAPDVEKVYQAFKDNPKVRVISVSEDRPEGRRAVSPEDVVTSFKDRGMTHGLVLDPASDVGQLYKATSFPTLFVLKGEKVEAVHIGAKPNLGDTLVDQVNDLLAGKPLKQEPPPPADAPKPQPERPAMTLLGKPAPKTTLSLQGGGSYELGSGDEIVVLNLYATWCGFSKRQAPDVEKVYQAFKDNPKVRVISVSEDRPEGSRAVSSENVVSSFKERGMTHGLALDPSGQVSKLYKTTGFPTLFVLKGDKVEAVHIGAKQNLGDTVINEVNQLLSGKAPAPAADQKPAEGVGRTQPPPPAGEPAAARQAAPAQPAAVAVPINTVDPVTGKPIGPNSPTTLYKGHFIAFCCDKSPAARGGWDGMSEVDKDAFVARFVQTDAKP